MLGLPKATELSKQLPKKAIYAKFNLSQQAKDKFDADVSRITIVNEISPATVAIEAGEDVKSFYILLLSLKRKNYDEHIISLLSRLIEQNMLFVLECENEIKLAVYRNKVISTEWQDKNTTTITLKGLNLDAVWQNIIVQIGDVRIEQGNTLDEQLATDERHAKLQKEIDRLEKLAWAEKQPNKKYELAKRINELKQQGNKNE